MSRKQQALNKHYAEKRRKEKETKKSEYLKTIQSNDIEKIVSKIGYKNNVITDIDMHKRMHGSACSNER